MLKEHQEAIRNPAAQKLMEAFVQFRRLHWKHSPIAGLTRGEFMVLSCLKHAAAHEAAGIKVSDISNILNVASPTVTQQINSLETHALVERSIDDEDRRVIR